MNVDQRRPLVVSMWSAGRARDDLLGLLSLFVFLIVTAALFRSWEFALLVTASLGFHEMGHALALAWFRLEYKVVFGLVGAYTWSKMADRAALSQLANTYIHLAGPLFSLGLALAALALHQLWQPDSRHLLVLSNFSAQIGFLNLLPLGALTDGGKALRRMAHSARRRRERLAILLLGTAGLAGPLLAAAWPVWQAGLGALPAAAAGFVLIGVWLAASLLLELRRDAAEPDPNSGAPGGRMPAGRAAPQAMNAGQLVFIALVFWDMLAALLLVILATPFWLEPRYLLGSVQNIEMLLSWVVKFL